MLATAEPVADCRGLTEGFVYESKIISPARSGSAIVSLTLFSEIDVDFIALPEPFTLTVKEESGGIMLASTELHVTSIIEGLASSTTELTYVGEAAGA